jgi:hypothetical protein
VRKEQELPGLKVNKRGKTREEVRIAYRNAIDVPWTLINRKYMQAHGEQLNPGVQGQQRHPGSWTYKYKYLHRTDD